MKSKTFIIALISCLIYAQTNAQIDSSKQTPRYEVGVNATAFFKQFVNFTTRTASDTSLNVLETPYYLIAKRSLGKGFLRVGVSVKINSENESSSKTADYKVKKNNDYQIRVGYEKQKKVNTRFKIYYGIDWLGGLNDLTVHANSGFDFVTISDRSWVTGIAPLAGLQFKLWDNIVLSTETSIRYRFTVFGESTKFSKNVDFDEKGVKLKTQKLDFLPPSVIYLSFLF